MGYRMCTSSATRYGTWSRIRSDTSSGPISYKFWYQICFHVWQQMRCQIWYHIWFQIFARYGVRSGNIYRIPELIPDKVYRSIPKNTLWGGGQGCGYLVPFLVPLLIPDLIPDHSATKFSTRSAAKSGTLSIPNLVPHRAHWYHMKHKIWYRIWYKIC